VPTPYLLAFASLLELLPGAVLYRLEHPVAYSALLRLLDHQGLCVDSLLFYEIG
jgi:hypothetical protein